jgi:hypothetical protein
MLIAACTLIANFTAPIEIGTTPASMLWMFPLVASVAIIYKATKLPKITTRNFIKETTVLFASIVMFMIAVAIVLYGFAWFVIE